MKARIKYQQQLTSKSCPLAVLAMLLDIDQIDCYHQVTNESTQFPLHVLLKHLQDNNLPVTECTGTEQIEKGNIYVLGVPALFAEPGGMHLIIADWSRETDLPYILDPAPQHQYTFAEPHKTKLTGWCCILKLDGKRYQELLHVKRKYLD